MNGLLLKIFLLKLWHDEISLLSTYNQMIDYFKHQLMKKALFVIWWKIDENFAMCKMSGVTLK